MVEQSWNEQEAEAEAEGCGMASEARALDLEKKVSNFVALEEFPRFLCAIPFRCESC